MFFYSSCYRYAASVQSFILTKGSRDVIKPCGPIAIRDVRVTFCQAESPFAGSAAARTPSPNEPAHQSTAATAATTRSSCCSTPCRPAGASSGCSGSPAQTATAATTVVANRCCLPPFIIPADHTTRVAGFLAARTGRFCPVQISLLLLFALRRPVRIFSNFHLSVLVLLRLSGIYDDGAPAPNAPFEHRSWGCCFGIRWQARLHRLCPGYLQGWMEQGKCWKTPLFVNWI